MIFTPAELECLRGLAIEWICEGFTTPPYDAVLYDIFDKLLINDEDSCGYDISRPQVAVRVKKVSDEC